MFIYLFDHIYFTHPNIIFSLYYFLVCPIEPSLPLQGSCTMEQVNPYHQLLMVIFHLIPPNLQTHKTSPYKNINRINLVMLITCVEYISQPYLIFKPLTLLFQLFLNSKIKKPCWCLWSSFP